MVNMFMWHAVRCVLNACHHYITHVTLWVSFFMAVILPPPYVLRGYAVVGIIVPWDFFRHCRIRGLSGSALYALEQAWLLLPALVCS
jgi:hypothetical protein